MTLRTIDGKEVSKICLGTMTWGQQNTEAEAHEQISYALHHGINMLDAAEMYPVPPRAETQGRTEEYIGTWFKKTGLRDKYILATKAAGPNPNSITSEVALVSRESSSWSVDGSLATASNGLHRSLPAPLARSLHKLLRAAWLFPP